MTATVGAAREAFGRGEWAAAFERYSALATATQGDGLDAADGQRLGDADLRAFGTLGHGQSLLALGEVAGGLAPMIRP